MAFSLRHNRWKKLSNLCINHVERDPKYGIAGVSFKFE